MYNAQKMIEDGHPKYWSAERGCFTVFLFGLSPLALAELDIRENSNQMRMTGCTPEDRKFIEGYRL